MSRLKKETVLNELNEFMSNGPFIYNNTKLLNRKGRTHDTEEYFEDLTAEFLCGKLEVLAQDIRALSSVRSKRRGEGDYISLKRNGKKTTDIAKKTTTEKMFALALFNRFHTSGADLIGRIIDYETPLKNKTSDKIGKIDLISVNNKDCFLLELKINDSESLIRSFLEIFTYYQYLNPHKETFFNSIQDKYEIRPQNLIPAILIPQNSYAHKTLTNCSKSLKQLFDEGQNLVGDEIPIFLFDCPEPIVHLEAGKPTLASDISFSKFAWPEKSAP